MPCVTTKSPDLRGFGPTIQVVITPSSAFLKHLKDTDTAEFDRYRRGVGLRLGRNRQAAAAASAGPVGGSTARSSEQHDEWTVARRDMAMEGSAKALGSDRSDPAEAPPRLAAE